MRPSVRGEDLRCAWCGCIVLAAAAFYYSIFWISGLGLYHKIVDVGEQRPRMPIRFVDKTQSLNRMLCGLIPQGTIGADAADVFF